MLTLSSGIGAGTGTGWPEIRSLQQALVGLSQVTGNITINPGTPNGFPNAQLRNAVIAAMGTLDKFLGAGVAGTLKAGLAIASIANPDYADGLILQYARQIDQAARAATLAYTQGGAVAPPAPGATLPPMIPPGAAAAPWYKTWWGAGAIAVGVVGVVAILAAPRRPAASTAA